MHRLALVFPLVAILGVVGGWMTNEGGVNKMMAQNNTPKETGMTAFELNHIHLGVRDLPAAIAWFDRVLQMKPVYQMPQFASFRFGAIQIFLDASEQDSKATIGILTANCDEAFARVEERGAVAEEKPNNKPYGVRAAYVKGPGALRLEFEQAIP